MRTTLDLSDRAYQLAKSLARERNIGFGRAISEIILEFTTQPQAGSRRMETKNGLPVVSTGKFVTSEDVKRILEEDE